MRKNIIILILLSLLLVASFVVPFFLRDKTESLNQTLSIASGLVSGVASLYTLIIAVLLFNKYGIESSYVQENTAKVFSLLEEIRKINFLMKNETASVYIEMIHPKRYFDAEKYGNMRLLFSNDFYKGLEKIFQLSNSPLIPQEVSWRINMLKFEYISFVDNEDDYFKVTFHMVELTPNERFGLFNGCDMTLSDFLTSLERIKTDILNWLDKNSSIPINLNL